MIDTYLASLSRFVHSRFIWLLIVSYIVAAFFPSAGLAIRASSWGTISLPTILVGFLLFNAGLGIELSELKHLRRNPGDLAYGLLANLLIPICFIWALMHTMRLWNDPDEVQNILVGLALVASMPIAGSSTAWSQNANGNMALSLGLILLSTLLRPVTTPVALHAVGLMTSGDYSEDLHELASSSTGWLFTASVLLIGMLIHRVLGKSRVTAAKPSLKLANSAILLLLSYSNASVSLPQAIATPDVDFLAVTLTITLLLCVIAFLAGWLITYLRTSDQADRVSLMFGLGMNNNGAGLVLTATALSDHPRVLVPIIFYDLVQHLLAGIVDFIIARRVGQGMPPRLKS